MFMFSLYGSFQWSIVLPIRNAMLNVIGYSDSVNALAGFGMEVTNSHYSARSAFHARV